MYRSAEFVMWKVKMKNCSRLPLHFSAAENTGQILAFRVELDWPRRSIEHTRITL